ncbi:hypothetical protein BDZ89DRAFT_1070690 [Hymenopellis radicata]|nr:hypothetical protein BDZ89DRAFT_1070690 [Hymenopellis radicata]
MPPALPQELIDQIVDDVQADPRPSWQQRADTVALLRAARCFGGRCRKYLYHKVDLALEITPPTVINKSLDMKSLCFMELVRRTPSLADLVKHIHYSLYFELNDTSYITSTQAWRMLQKFAPYLTRVDMVTLNFYDSRDIWDSSDSQCSVSLFRMTLDSQVLEAIGVIIPSCPFSRLRIQQTSLLPAHLVGFLAHCPHVTSLEIREISDPLGGSGTLQSQIPAVPPKIEELIFTEADAFIFEMVENHAFRAVVASTRRLVFSYFEEGRTMSDEDRWDTIGEFMSQLVTLEKVFFLLGHNFNGGDDVRTLVHAPSLCLEMSYGASLPKLSSALRQNPSYPSKLRNLAMVVHADCTPDRNPTIAHWRELASVLHQPRFAALETVCVTFVESPRNNHPPLIEEEVSRCFANFSAKVTVRKLDLSVWPQVYTYFETFF